MTLASGARLGPYEIVELIGRGGMGEVYRAIDARLVREVAIKVLPPDLVDHAESLARFRREARAIAARAFDIEQIGSSPWAELELFAARIKARIGVTGGVLRPGGDIVNGLATLISARTAWQSGDLGGARQLLRRARADGIDATWFAEEAALLEYDLGAPPRGFKPDPPYPNRLRFIAVWELARAGK